MPDEYTPESLAILVHRKLSLVDALTDIVIQRGQTTFVRADIGPDFVAEVVRRWTAAVGARPAFIEPGSPCENGDIESFNARRRDELLDDEVLYTQENQIDLSPGISASLE